MRAAHDPDPSKKGSTGTAVLRRYGVVDNTEAERVAFSLLFANRTLDMRAETHDDYVYLLRGFRALRARRP